MNDPTPTLSAAADEPVGRRARTLTHDVVVALTDRIRHGDIRAGDKLPSEAEIMQAFGVSRGVVREALSRLQAARLVETHHGVGTFALEYRDNGFLRVAAPPVRGVEDVLAVLELRMCLESESAALAAVRRSPAHLQEMRRAVEEFGGHTAVAGETVSPDYRFHRAIADATGNPYVADLMHQLGPRVIPRTRVPASQLDPDQREEHLRRVHAEHEQILAAIERGDPDSARAAMRIHLVNSRERQRRAAG
jgi:GntR family transcriptional repressor for pyruvate dehydrogenase complex